MPALKSQVVNEAATFYYDTIMSSYEFGSSAHTSFKKSFINVSSDSSLLNGKKLAANLQPAFSLQHGIQNKAGDYGNQALDYAIGIKLKAQYSSRWNAAFLYLRSFSNDMIYRQQFMTVNGVRPGTNVTSFNNETNLYAADYFSSFVNFKASSIFDFELGYGRNFIGDGYRSLLRSDFANASPYLKITTKFWKLQYTNLFSSHQNIFGVEQNQGSHQKKYTATHYLDWKATKWLSVGIFETIVWQAKEKNYTRGFDVNYANPVIFYRPVEYSVGSSDNALVGANIKVTPFKNHVFYGQFIFDEFLLTELRADLNQFLNPKDDIRSGWWANKYGVQLGWTAFDFLRIKGLQTRVEFNLVRPYTYAHSAPIQAYSTYNLSLAHPLGANFHEAIVKVNYIQDRWIFGFQYNQSRRGISLDSSNVGNNIELSNASRANEYENSLTQGVPVTVKYLETSIGYVVQEKTKTTASMGFVWREQNTAGQLFMNNMIMLGLKTNLYNQYWDY
jgi:hypothetical protein